eukprot:43145-Hanusia_phi.AAC.2
MDARDRTGLSLAVASAPPSPPPSRLLHHLVTEVREKVFHLPPTSLVVARSSHRGTQPSPIMVEVRHTRLLRKPLMLVTPQKARLLHLCRSRQRVVHPPRLVLSQPEIAVRVQGVHAPSYCHRVEGKIRSVPVLRLRAELERNLHRCSSYLQSPDGSLVRVSHPFQPPCEEVDREPAVDALVDPGDLLDVLRLDQER